MSTTMTVTKPQPPALRAGVMDHSIYPPIERFQTIDGVIRSHAAEEEQKPAICYPVKAAADFEEHTPAEVDRYTDTTAQYYIDQGLQPAVRIDIFRPSAICHLPSAICKTANISLPGSFLGEGTSRSIAGWIKLRNYPYISRSEPTWLCCALPVHTSQCLCIC
jgi:hypothetical protein